MRGLPFYAELIRADRGVRRSATELARIARSLLVTHVQRRPERNPIEHFGRRFAADLSSIQARGLAFYHQFAFATIRQFGAAYELLAQHLRWIAKA